MECHYNVYKIIIVCSVIIMHCQADGEHRTKAATQKVADHFCYQCDSMLDKRCENISDVIKTPEMMNFQLKCAHDQRFCKVKRISMSTSTEDNIGIPKLWLLQRNCTKNCEEGCIVIGERTKLRSCTTCCDKDYCNDGNGIQTIKLNPVMALTLVVSCALASKISFNYL